MNSIDVSSLSVMKSNPSTINKAQLEKYFKIISFSPKTIFTACVFDDSTGEPFSGYSCISGKAASLIEKMLELEKSYPEEKLTLHLVLNDTNLKGRKTENIVGCKCLCVDIDRETSLSDCKELVRTFKPHMVVESSPKKYHFYWALDSGISLTDWSCFQLGLAYALDADLEMGTITKLIRVPGVPRVTKTGEEFTPRILHYIPCADGRMTRLDVLKEWPSIIDWSVLGKEKRALAIKERVKKLREGIRIGKQHKLKPAGLGKIDLAGCLEVGRNVTLYTALKDTVYLACKEQEKNREALVKSSLAGLDSSPRENDFHYPQVKLLAEELNSKFPFPLSDREVSVIIDSAIRHGIEAYDKAKKREYLRVVEVFDTMEVMSDADRDSSSANSKEKKTVDPASKEKVLGDSFLTLDSKSSEWDNNGTHATNSKVTDFVIDFSTSSPFCSDTRSSNYGDRVCSSVGRNGVVSETLGKQESLLLSRGEDNTKRDKDIPSRVSEEIEAFRESRAKEAGSSEASGIGRIEKKAQFNESGVKGASSGTTFKPFNKNSFTIRYERQNRFFEGKEELSRKELSTIDSPQYFTTLEEAARAWGRAIYQGRNGSNSEPGVRVSQVLRLCKKDSSWYELGVLMLEYWVGRIGSATKYGMFCFMQSYSLWGSEILAPKKISRDELKALVTTAVHEIVRFGVKDGALSDELKKTYAKLPTSSAINQLSEVIERHSLIVKHTEVQDPSVIVFQNGVFHLDSLEFREDSLAPIKYSHPIHARFMCDETGRASVNTPVFDKYLEDWFPGDTGTLLKVLMWLGYSMTTDNTRQCFAYFYGPARAGKGSITEVISGILGENNWSPLNYGKLDERFGLANTQNRLLVIADELTGSYADNQKRMGLMKQITGGGKIQLERKFKDVVDDYIFAKFIFQSNERLNYQDKGNAIRSRCMVLGFEQSFEDNPGRSPSKEILNTDADRLATRAAILWSQALRYHTAERKKGRNLGHILISNWDGEIDSHAQEIGKKEVIDSMNVLERIILKYIHLEKGIFTPQIVLTELMTYIIDTEGYDVPLEGHKGRVFSQQIKTTFRITAKTKRVSTDRLIKAYDGLTINQKVFLNDYPDIFDADELEYPNLIEYMTLACS